MTRGRDDRLDQLRDDLGPMSHDIERLKLLLRLNDTTLEALQGKLADLIALCKEMARLESPKGRRKARSA